MINVIIVSDIKIYCEGLHHIFARASAIHVLGSVSDCKAAKAMVAKTLPDVVLLDMTMAYSCELAQSIASTSARTKIVALAVPCDEGNILECAEAGITGYVLREASIEELIEAIIWAAKGECYCPPKIAACILKKLHEVASYARARYPPSTGEGGGYTEHTGELQSRLTRREWQIALLLSNGLSNKQIARDLSIEVSTVKNHVHNLLAKMEVKSRCQAISLLQKMVPLSNFGSLDLEPKVEAFS